MEAQGVMPQLWEAVDKLTKVGISATRQAFGFSVELVDNFGRVFAECGLDHDYSISICVHTGTPPVQWFFRRSVPSMVEFLIAAQVSLKSGETNTWLEALHAIDDQMKRDGDLLG